MSYSEQLTPRGRRLFFALWPDVATRAALAAITPALRVALPADARVSRANNLHLTLAFLGTIALPVEARLLRLVKDIAASGSLSSPTPVALAPFTVSLDTLDYWPHNRILFAAPATPPGALAALAARVHALAITAGISMPDAVPFRAHVTLARQVPARTEAWQWPLARPIPWRVDRFALVRSRPTPAGPAYQVLADWPLSPTLT